MSVYETEVRAGNIRAAIRAIATYSNALKDLMAIGHGDGLFAQDARAALDSWIQQYVMLTTGVKYNV